MTIVTGDRDAFQLIDPDSRDQGDGHRRAASPTPSSTTTRRSIDRYGIPPESIPDFYGLKGDTSDNIPGVPGIGDKTGADLLQRFGDLETVLASVDEISGAKRKENLVNHADDARISKQLATIQRDVPVDIDAARRGSPASPTARGCARSSASSSCATRCGASRRRSGEGDAAAPAPAAEQDGHGARARGRRSPTSQALPGRRRARARRDRARGAPRASCSRARRMLALRRRRRARTSLVGDVPRPEAVVLALGDRPVVAHDAKALGARARANLAHDTLLGAYLLEPARRGFPFRELCEERGLAAGVRGRRRRPTAAARAARWRPGSASRSTERGLGG